MVAPLPSAQPGAASTATSGAGAQAQAPDHSSAGQTAPAVLPVDASLFQAAFTHAWNAIVITDADPAQGYRVLFANPAFCQMTGYGLDELQGRSLKLLQGPDTDADVIERLRQCLREARYFEGTTVNYRKDGSAYVVRWNISPVWGSDGRLTHFVSVQQDLSELVYSQQQNLLLERALQATAL